MIQRIKNYLLIAITGLTLAAPGLVPLTTSAACSSIANQVSSGANGAASGNNSPDCDSSTGVNDTSITNTANRIVDVFSIIVGIVAVIMIIYGGFRYITSGGDSTKVGSSKNTLIYAIIGLVIVALAQIIVKFVLNQTSTVGTQ